MQSVAPRVLSSTPHSVTLELVSLSPIPVSLFHVTLELLSYPTERNADIQTVTVNGTQTVVLVTDLYPFSLYRVTVFSVFAGYSFNMNSEPMTFMTPDDGMPSHCVHQSHTVGLTNYFKILRTVVPLFSLCICMIFASAVDIIHA